MNINVDGASNAQELVHSAYQAIMSGRRGNSRNGEASYARALLGAKGDGSRIIEGMIAAKVWGTDGPESYSDLVYTHQGYDMNKNKDRYLVLALYRSDRAPPILPLPFTPLHYAPKRPNWITVDFIGTSFNGMASSTQGSTGLKAVNRIEVCFNVLCISLNFL